MLSTNDFETSSVFVSNPVQNELNIKGLSSSVRQVSIYNLFGKLLLETKVNNQSSLRLEISNFSSGMYIVKLAGNNLSFTKKIIKN